MSGYIEEFWTHPTDLNAMFMGPDMHVSYGTWNGGKSWHTLKDPDGLGQEMKRVLDIEFSLQNPNYGMAIDWNGWVYETTNMGRSWEKTAELGRNYKEIGIDPNDPQSFEKGWYYEQMGTRHSELAVDPANDLIWYVGAGDFWNVKENHKSADKPHGNRFMYADYGHIWKTTDKGKTWTKITNGLPEDLDIAKIIINPENSDHLIMATSHGILSSRDGGISWQSEVSGVPHNLPRDLTSYHDSETGEFVLFMVEQTVFEDRGDTVGAVGGVYQSVDGGVNWEDVTGNLPIDMSAIDSPEERFRYYRSISHWFGISHNDAQSKYPRLPESILPVFNRIVVNPLNRKEIYLTYNKKHDHTFGPGEVWRTLDGGKTWKVVARHGKYWKSGQDAEYWKSRGNATGTNIEFAHLQEYMDRMVEISGNRLLVMNAAGDLFISVDQQMLKSVDKGDTWFQVDDDETSPGSKHWIGRGDSNLPGRFMLHETGIEGRRLLASGEHGLWQTTGLDGWTGRNAVAVEQIEGQKYEDGMHSISTVAVHPDDPDTIYILAWRQEHRGKLRRTTDGGISWEDIATIFEADSPLGQNVATQNSLTIDPETPRNMYFAATYLRVSEIHNGPGVELSRGEYGFYRSLDGGYTWEPANEGFHEGASVRRIAMHPDNPEVIYAALNDDHGGLFRTEDKGSSWHRLDIPSVIKAVNNVFIDRNNKHIYISAGRNAGTYEEGGVWRSVDQGLTWSQIFKAPFVWQAETSPVKPDMIVISVAGQKVSMADPFMNPGIYLSQDAGETWRKINRNLGQPDKIVDVKPDPYDENVLWCAAWGSGWQIARLNSTESSDVRFDSARDLFLPQFDSKTDVDDVHSVAAVATMLRDPRLADVNYHAVAGAYGIQDGLYVPAPGVFDLAFGARWSDAHQHREQALEEVAQRVGATLAKGGHVWVAEAGQSDFTADWLRRVKEMNPSFDSKTRIHVVQHSDWNESMASAEKLTFVQQNADYRKIADGNAVGNGSPGFRLESDYLWERVLRSGETGEIWRHAKEVAENYNGQKGRYNNTAVSAGGMDFSDAAESCWILGFADLKDAEAFILEFLDSE